MFVQVIGDRDLVKHIGYVAFYDMDWIPTDFTLGSYEQYDESHRPKCPQNWNRMVEIARKLSEGFDYVRVDLYSLGNKILFGEMTFTPGNGLYPKFAPLKADFELGKLLNLPPKYPLAYPGGKA